MRVVDLLQDESWVSRTGAVAALALVLRERPGTAEDLVDMASDEDARVRVAALAALAACGAGDNSGFPLRASAAHECVSFLLLLAEPAAAAAERALAVLALLNIGAAVGADTASRILAAADAQFAGPGAPGKLGAVAAAVAAACVRFGERHPAVAAALARSSGAADAADAADTAAAPADAAALDLAVAGARHIDPGSFQAAALPGSRGSGPRRACAPGDVERAPVGEGALRAVCRALHSDDATAEGLARRHARFAVATGAASAALRREAAADLRRAGRPAPPALLLVEDLSVAAVEGGGTRLRVRVAACVVGRLPPPAALEATIVARVPAGRAGGSADAAGAAPGARHRRVRLTLRPAGVSTGQYLFLYPTSAPGLLLLPHMEAAAAGLWALRAEADAEARAREAEERAPLRERDPLWALPPAAAEALAGAPPVQVARKEVFVSVPGPRLTPSAAGLLEITCQLRHASGLHSDVAAATLRGATAR